MKFKVEERKRLKCAICHAYLPNDPITCKRCADLGEKLNVLHV